MRKLILLASAAAIAATIPNLAQAQGRGHGQSGQAAHGKATSAGARTAVRSRGNARTDARANARARTRTGASVDRRIDSDGDGIPDYRERARRADRDGDGIPDYRDRVDNRGNRYGGAVCPPGLANRTPACVPPGQARRMLREGQRIPASYGDFVPYDNLLASLPESYRDDIPAGYRYVYSGDNVYVVDRRTRLIRDVINILR